MARDRELLRTVKEIGWVALHKQGYPILQRIGSATLAVVLVLSCRPHFYEGEVALIVDSSVEVVSRKNDWGDCHSAVPIPVRYRLIRSAYELEVVQKR